MFPQDFLTDAVKDMMVIQNHCDDVYKTRIKITDGSDDFTILSYYYSPEGKCMYLDIAKKPKKKGKH